MVSKFDNRWRCLTFIAQLTADILIESHSDTIEAEEEQLQQLQTKVYNLWQKEEKLQQELQPKWIRQQQPIDKQDSKIQLSSDEKEELSNLKTLTKSLRIQIEDQGEQIEALQQNETIQNFNEIRKSMLE